MIQLRDGEQLLTTQELADFYQVHKSQISTLRARHNSPPAMKFGRISYTRRSDAEAWLLSGFTDTANV